MDKKLGSKVHSGHFNVATPPSHKNKVQSVHTGTNLSIEIVEVGEIQDREFPLVGGPYICILEVVDTSIQHAIWKQKTSAQFTTRAPIIFGDIFKVKNFTGEWGVDIKSGFALKVQFCRMEDKTPVALGSTSIELQDLVVNKEQQKVEPFEGGNAELVLRLTLSNTQYPRGNNLTLREINLKEKEKEKTNEQPEKDRITISRTPSTSSYSLPRITVFFSINYHTIIGEEIRIVGSNYKLGDWDASKAPFMQWNYGGVWTLSLSFRKAFVPFEYKYVVFNTQSGHVRWESIANRKVELTEEESVHRGDAWDREN